MAGADPLLAGADEKMRRSMALKARMRKSISNVSVLSALTGDRAFAKGHEEVDAMPIPASCDDDNRSQCCVLTDSGRMHPDPEGASGPSASTLLMLTSSTSTI